MYKSFDQLFSELETLFTSPNSYGKSESDSKSIECIQQQLIQLLNGKNRIDDTIIYGIGSMLDNIFSSQKILVDYSGLGNYLRSWCKKHRTIHNFQTLSYH